MEGLWPHIVLTLLVFVAVGATLVALGFVGHPTTSAFEISLAGQSVSTRTDVMLSTWATGTLVRRVLGPVPRPPTAAAPRGRSRE